MTQHHRTCGSAAVLVVWFGAALAAHAATSYVNFESSHVHPIATAGERLLAVNTPDAVLEVWTIEKDGSLTHEAAIPVGLEPVTVVARTDTEAWVVNNLSDTVSIVDLLTGTVTQTLHVGDEPTDVVFAAGKAFVAVSQEDAVKVYTLASLSTPPTVVPLFARDIRALATTGTQVYAVALRSGNQTTVVNGNIIFDGNQSGLSASRLAALNLTDITCNGAPPGYPPLPTGIARNPALTDPPATQNPPVSLIVSWDEANTRWADEDGSDWTHCLPYRLPDHDLFAIDATSLAVTEVDHLGTSLFEVSVQPGTGRIYVPATDARNSVRFEHPLGVQGHVVDNLFSVVDPGAGNSVTRIDLNTHINRGSDPATNLAERVASISQPGMMVWNSTGSTGYLTAIGSRKVFRVAGGCLTGGCVFGATRATPDVVESGEGPTGVALHEGHDRLYVLNRISHSLAVVEASTLTLLETLPLHDPSSDDTRLGRRFLYDGIDSSGHGDAACSSCHLSGDLDGLGWDLGDPTGEMVAYSTEMDNVRFVVPMSGIPVQCDPTVCASHEGFDPQKGPMTTQTLRGMLEPLHWRGDRPTMNDFNVAFVGLMGKEDIGPISGKPAGLSATDMERFRQFALALSYPPNPNRDVNDSTPCPLRSVDPNCEVQPFGSIRAGNPTEGALLFDGFPSDASQPCLSCHTHPFGAGGGTLGGVAPTEPTTPTTAALFNGDADESPHSDLKIPHLRNIYDKPGPVLPDPMGPVTETKTGFGLIHDGSVPDMFRFLSNSVFSLPDANQARELRDISTFMFYFPTGIKPSVGRQATVPAGAPPTGSAGDETLIATLISLGDRIDSNRHCDLAAAALSGGRMRRWHLHDGSWNTDAAAEPPVSTTTMRTGASGPVTFTCVTLDSGPRLGGDLDEDIVLDGDDCAPADAASWAPTITISNLTLEKSGVTQLSWGDQSVGAGPGLAHDVLGGDLSALRTFGIAATTCVDGSIQVNGYDDPRTDPVAGDGYVYLVRITNGCGTATLGVGRGAAETVVCP
jgi:YVTN family beta-propeller protein